MTQVQRQKTQERVTIGTDPEFFLQDTNSGRLVPAINFITGTKEEPQYLPSGAGLQWDNVAMEFSTPPAKDAEDMIEKIRTAFIETIDVLPKEIEIVALASAEFESSDLANPEAQKFGCDPDFDAWALVQNNPPDPNMTSLRSCGGHIHVGYQKNTGCAFLIDMFGKAQTIRAMDAFHGVVSVVLDNTESAVRRRELYGKAGCFRDTSYGVEYRVLSNFWLQTPSLVKLMDSLTLDMLDHMKSHPESVVTNISDNVKIVNTIGVDDLQTIINKSKVSDAKTVVDVYLSKYLSANTTDLIMEALDIVAQPTINLKKEWGII